LSRAIPLSFDRYRHSPLGTAWKILSRRVIGRRLPLIANLTLTYRCNLRCQYCGIWKAPGAEMSRAEVGTLIDQIAAAGGERLSFGGGEPMLRDDVGDLVSHAKACGLTVNLLSNGYQVPERIDELRGLDFFTISLDGPPAVHDRLRGAGSFAAALSAIRAARGAGIEVWVTAVITRHNHDRIAELVAIAHDQEVRLSVQPVMQESLMARHVERLAPSREDFVKVIDGLIAAKAHGNSPIAMSDSLLRFYRDHWSASQASLHPGARQGGVLPCQAAALFCSVSPDGRLFPCNFLHSSAAPSCLELGFAEAFRRLQAPDCAGCWCDSFIESNLVFNFDPVAILNVLQLLASPARQRPSATHSKASSAPTAK
jgi:MoaA/NifB/PqqE/SkfB family radical SAM enzyme